MDVNLFGVNTMKVRVGDTSARGICKWVKPSYKRNNKIVAGSRKGSID